MIYKNFLNKLKKKGGCPFCKNEKEFTINENKFAYLTPAQAPYVKDHLLVIPKRHVLLIEKLKGKEKKGIFDLVIYGIKLLEKKYPAANVEYREGDLKISGKSIEHLHFHIIPRAKKGSIKSNSKRKFLSRGELTNETSKLKKNGKN